MSSFNDYKLKPYIVDAIKDLGFVSPTKVQSLVIPKALKNKSLVVESATGSGKTHAFMIPAFNNLNEFDPSLQIVIIAPTRELAEQLYLVASHIASFSSTEIRIAKAYGGNDRSSDIKKFNNNNPQILIGTIGRIHDLAVNNNALKIHNAKMVIIDEADMIFDERELIEVDHIMAKFIASPTFLIFSATIAKGLRIFLNKYLQNVETIVLEEKNLTNNNIKHLMLQCKAKDKKEILLELLKIISPFLCLIFVNTKENCDELALYLAEYGYKVAKLHGDMSDRDRKQVIKRIRNLEFKYVIATDIASRGIDIEAVSHVINFDLPKDIEFYIHRTGRTARANATGEAISLYSYDDDAYVKLLRNKGLIVNFVKISDNELVLTKLERKIHQKSIMKEIEEKAHQTTTMPKKVKPGYKKKRKLKIEKKIKDAKKAHIKDIYKTRAKNAK